MLDLILDLVFAGVSFIAADFVKGIGLRLAQRWLPTRSEQFAMEDIKVRREELQAAERRFLDERQAQREFKLLEIEKTRELHREDEERKAQYQRWPLQILPVDFLRASAAREGRALNIVFTVAEHRDEHFLRSNDEGIKINRLLDVLNSSPLHAMRQASAHFQGDIIFYHETLKTRHTGDSLRSTLWSLLQTEPTVLVEINIPKPDEFKIYVSHWGGAFEPKAPWVSDYPQTINLTGASDNTEAALSLGLSGLIVALGDTFRILHRPYDLQSPVFPVLMRDVRPSIPIGTLQPMFKSYTSAYENVARHSPVLASEMAAHAAIVAQQAQQKEFAESLLDTSLRLHPALRGAGEVDPVRLAMFLRQRRREQRHSEIGKALQLIRELPANIDGADSTYGDKSLEDFMRRFSLQKKEGN